MRSLVRFGFRQLAGLWLAALLLMVAGLTTLHWHMERAELLEAMTTEASTISANAGAALAFNDEASATETLSALRHSKSVLEAALFRNNGTLLAHYRRDDVTDSVLAGRHAPTIGNQFSLREILLTAPVTIEDQQIGLIALRDSQDSLYLEVLRFASGFVLIASIITAMAYLVTGRLRRRVAETEGRLDTVTDLMPITIFQLVAGDGIAAVFTYVSDGAIRSLGIPAAKLLGDSRALLDIVQPEDAGALRSLIEGTHAAEDLRYGFVWSGRLVRREGGEAWIEMRATAEADAQGKMTLNGAIFDVSALKHSQNELEASRALLKRMITHREMILEEEHKRIAIEIHDQLGQILTAAMLNLRLLERKLQGADAESIAQIDGVRHQLNQAYLGMKTIASSLHPAVLQFGLVAAIEWLTEQTLKPAGLHWRIDAETFPARLGQRESMALFRIAQEALTNVVRHAHAANVLVKLAAAGEAVIMEIADDGRGIAVEAGGGQPKFGLTGMRERAEALDGRLEIGRADHGGTLIRVIMPLVGDNPPLVETEPNQK